MPGLKSIRIWGSASHCPIRDRSGHQQQVQIGLQTRLLAGPCTISSQEGLLPASSRRHPAPIIISCCELKSGTTAAVWNQSPSSRRETCDGHACHGAKIASKEYSGDCLQLVAGAQQAAAVRCGSSCLQALSGPGASACDNLAEQALKAAPDIMQGTVWSTAAVHTKADLSDRPVQVKAGRGAGQNHRSFQVFCGNAAKAITAWEPPDDTIQDKVRGLLGPRSSAEQDSLRLLDWWTVVGLPGT